MCPEHAAKARTAEGSERVLHSRSKEAPSHSHPVSDISSIIKKSRGVPNKIIVADESDVLRLSRFFYIKKKFHFSFLVFFFFCIYSDVLVFILSGKEAQGLVRPAVDSWHELCKVCVTAPVTLGGNH